MAKPAAFKDRGRRIRQGRESLGITGAALGHGIGATRQYVSALEAGRVSGKSKLPKLAKALRTTIEWLTAGTGKAPSWAMESSSDYAGALASLDAAGSIVKQVAHARKADAKAALDLIGRARDAVAKLGG